MTNPTVSIILPTFNQARFLPAAIRSVLAQTFSRFELIVVNDGSTDGTAEYLASLTDPRIHVIHQENRRLPKALNAGFEIAAGKYLTWISSDNSCAPIFLEALVAALEANPEAAMANSAFAWVDDEGRITRIHRDQDLSWPSMIHSNPGIASFLYRRQCQDELGLYNPELEGAEDWDMWLRIVEKHQTVYVPEILYYYRQHAQSMTATKAAMVASAAKQAARLSFERMSGQIDLERVYPQIALCQHSERAKTVACAQLGASLLTSPHVEPDRAIPLLQAAFDLEPRAEWLSNLAVGFARAGRWQEAKMCLPHLRKSPNAAIRQNLLRIESASSNSGAAPANFAVIMPSRENEEFFEHARQAQRVFSYTTSCGWMAVQHGPKNVPAGAGSGEESLRKADEAFGKGDLTLARLHLRSAVEKMPQAVEVVSTLGSVAFQLGDAGEALVSFQRAIQLKPTDPTLHVQLAMAAQAAQNAGLFIDALAEALRLDEKCRVARRLLADSLVRTGNLAEAARQYLVLAEQDPQDVSALLALGSCFARGNEWESAARVFEAALAASPENPEAREWLTQARDRLSHPATTTDIIDSADQATQAVAQPKHNQTANARRVLFVSHDASRTGAPLYLLRLLRAFQGTGVISPRVLLLRGGPLEKDFRDLAPTVRWDELGQMSGVLSDIEVIYSNTCTNGDALAQFSWGNVPIITHVHELPASINDLVNDRLLAVKTQTTRFIACSGAVAQGLETQFGVAADRIETIYAGVDCDWVTKQANASEREAARKALGVTSRTFVVGACGTVMPHKGPDLFLKAAKACRDRAADAEFLFIWIGAMPSADVAGSLAREAARLGLNNHVRFLGETDNPHPWINACDAFCLPSRVDAFPLTMLEAGALGKPTICFEGSGGAVEFCSMGGGRAVRYEDAEQMAQALIELMVDGEARARAGEKALECVKEHFTWSACVSRIRSLVERVTDQRSHVVSEQPKAVPQTRVSIIIPTFNKIELTRQCLRALAQNTPPGLAEIIVVDNGSTDGTPGFLAAEQQAGRLRAILNPVNLGYARASNIGAAAAKTPYLLFLNNDTEARPGWLEPLLAVAETDPRVGAVGSKLLFPNGTIQHAGVGIFNDQPYGDPFVARHLHYAQPENSPGANVAMTYPVLTAASLLIPAPIFRETGGFDEGFWNGYEDVDLCFKISHTGRVLVYQPASVLVHHESQSGPERFSKTRQNVERLNARWLERIEPDFSISKDRKYRKNPCSRIARYVPPREHPKPRCLVSIIILALNQLEDTRKCLDSIARFTNLPHEILLVDNGSTDGTAGFLAQWQTEHPNCTIIRNEKNHGFAAGNNQALGLARGEFVVLLNNDTVVTEGWLEGMKRLFEEDGELGVVGPMTNYVVGPQLVPKVSYRSLEELPGFAANWRKTHAGETLEINRVIGFCAMIRRSVLDQIGGLDPVFNSGNFEDDDFCLRAVCAGFKIKIARDVFIHHTGSQTFKGAGIDYRKTMLKNWEIFKSKWRLPADAPLERGYRPFNQSPVGVSLHVPVPDLRHTHARSPERESWRETPDLGETVVPKQVEDLARPITSTAAAACSELGTLEHARSLLAAKQLPESWQACCVAVTVRPFHPDGFMLLAEIAEAAGDWAGARLCADHARSLAPGWKAPRKYLKRCPKGGTRPEWLALPDALQKAGTSGSRLSVCLITRNEEKFISQSLESVKDLAHQIIVVDTGSTDRTVELAKAHGAKIHHFDWCDDFSAARNAGLEHATGDWILILDADEELSSKGREDLKKQMADPAVMAWRLPLINLGSEGSGRTFVPRLFRNAPGLFFTGRVHEQVFPKIDELRSKWGLENRLGTAELLHHGYTAAMLRERNKIERNLKLLELAVHEKPNDAHVLMNLGLELCRSGRQTEGLEYYGRAYRLLLRTSSAQFLPELVEFFLTQYCTFLNGANQPQTVIEVLNSRLAKVHRGLTATHYFILGLAHLDLEEYTQAAEQMERCIAKRNETALTPVNEDIHTAAPFHCLALALNKTGDTHGAEKAFQEGLKEKAGVEKMALDFAGFLVEQNRPIEGLQQLHSVIATHPGNLRAWLLGGQIALSQPEFLEFAGDWTAEALKNLPHEVGVQSLRAEALLLSGKAEAALELLLKVVEAQRHPRNLSALILCETLRGRVEHQPLHGEETMATTQAFFDWYRKCLNYNLKGLIIDLNNRLPVLRQALPEAAEILGAALHEAVKPEEAEKEECFAR